MHASTSHLGFNLYIARRVYKWNSSICIRVYCFPYSWTPINNLFKEIKLFSGQYHPVLDTTIQTFKRDVLLLLSTLGGVSPLQFQVPQVTYDSSNIYYVATLVEHPLSLRKFNQLNLTLISYSYPFPVICVIAFIYVLIVMINHCLAIPTLQNTQDDQEQPRESSH